MITRSLSAVAFAALLGLSTFTASSDANALPGAQVGCSTTADGWPVCVGTTDAGGAGGGPSNFLGAFAMGSGGWMEVYSDKDGVWWVEHNTDGSVTIGEDDLGGGGGGGGGGGAKKKKSANNIQNVPGTYTKSSRAVGVGPAMPAVKPNVTALKAQAAQVTGSFASATPSKTSVPLNGPAGSRDVAVSFGGTGTCSALMIVTKYGQLVSTTGIVKMSFPAQRTIQLPNSAGTYKVELIGNTGCMPSKKSTFVSVTAPPAGPYGRR